MDNYAAYWQARNKQPDTLPPTQKALIPHESAVEVAQVNGTQSTEHQFTTTGEIKWQN